MTNVDRKNWMDQWSRIARHVQQLQEVRSGRAQDRAHPSYYTDIAYATFQNIWHLKDWLKSDPVTAPLVSDIEQYWQAEPDLILTADLANGSKHLVLKHPKGDPTANIKGGLIEWEPGDRPKIAITFYVEANGKTYDAMKVAIAARDSWERYLKSKKLL